MSVLEAAEWMERVRGTRLMVRDGERVVGVLTEEDIVEKVLRAGLRPDVVRVADIMNATVQAPDGIFLLEGDPRVRAWVPEERPRLTVLEGMCDDCGDRAESLRERGGLTLCPECFDAGAIEIGRA